MLYLVQHGAAKPEEEDPERSLSDIGKKEAEKTAAALSRSGLKPDAIYHSPKLRAKQTAEIFASCLGIPCLEMQGLLPNDDPAVAAKFVESSGKSLMLVGHLPHLSSLASLLVTGQSGKEIIRFRYAAVACLIKEDGWRITWILPPELA